MDIPHVFRMALAMRENLSTHPVDTFFSALGEMLNQIPSCPWSRSWLGPKSMKVSWALHYFWMLASMILYFT